MIALVVLGPKRLPELTRAAGKSIREFREALTEAGGHSPSASIPVSASGVVEEQPPITQTEREPE